MHLNAQLLGLKINDFIILIHIGKIYELTIIAFFIIYFQSSCWFCLAKLSSV